MEIIANWSPTGDIQLQDLLVIIGMIIINAKYKQH